MLYRKLGQTGVDVSILGFGCMRLPLVKSEQKITVSNAEIDEPEATRILRWAIDNGVNYIDTAYPYHSGNSELFLGRALQDGYRQKVYLATKMPGRQIKSRGDMDRILNEQLKKLQTDFIDFYLVQAVSENSWPGLVQNNLFEFLDTALADGRIRYAGFSFHSELPLFKEVVNAYDWSFCQIQYNYLDGNFQAGKAGLECAVERGLGVVIMEPLRGGKLASDVPPGVEQIWRRAKIKRSPAEWALRFLWDHPGISVVLSGMSRMEQVVENVRIAGQALPNTLTPEEKALIEEAKEFYLSRAKVNCTQCRYCMPCPIGVNIPGCLTLLDNMYIFGEIKTNRMFYKMYMSSDEQKASNCIECGTCEKKCPQNIPIRSMLKEVVKVFEE